MTKQLLSLSLVLPLLLVGCVTYDDDEGSSADTAALDDTTTEGPVLSFFPPQAELGENFIGYVGLEEGSLDLDLVTDIEFQGDIQIGSTDVRSSELVLSLQVPEFAEEGDVDLLIVLDDQDAIWLDAAITLYPSESGMSAGEYDPEAEDADDCD